MKSYQNKEKTNPTDVFHEKKTGEAQLILFNDDVTPFDFVAESLICVCGHSPEQAEQCTMIAHFNGKCVIKKGTHKILQPMMTALADKGLSVVME